jgi:ectoine hydroxylase-related dioxygenase (phytanoyl-CoA dioxygenase family)
MAKAPTAAAAAAPSRDWGAHAAELEDRGWTVVPDVLPLDLCTRAKAHVDSLLAPIGTGGAVAARSHPIPGGIMGELATTPLLMECASALYRSPFDELRLTEQVLIRTDPEPPTSEQQQAPSVPMPAGGGEPRGWHCDFVFQEQHFHATPRQNYFQMFGVFTDVLPGAGCTMVVPGSHHKTMAAAAQTDCTIEALGELRGRIAADPAEFGIDIDAGIELPASAGSLVIFCPFCLHSGSVNRGSWSRYVAVQSFNHCTDAELLQQQLVSTRYLKGFHPDAHAAVPPSLRQVLKGPGLWGEAMNKELASFGANGCFLIRIGHGSLLSEEISARAAAAQQAIGPAGQGVECPDGMDSAAVRSLMAVKALGEELVALLEAPATLALAAELLDMEERGVGGGASDS